MDIINNGVSLPRPKVENNDITNEFTSEELVASTSEGDLIRTVRCTICNEDVQFIYNANKSKWETKIAHREHQYSYSPEFIFKRMEICIEYPFGLGITTNWSISRWNNGATNSNYWTNAY